MAHFLSKEGVKMKRFLIGGVMVMLIAGCGESKLKQEDIVCVYTHPAFVKVLKQYQLSLESVFSCTNKAGEAVNGILDWEKMHKIYKETRKIYFKDGFITKYEIEGDYFDKDDKFRNFKRELFFENGKFVKGMQNDKDYSFDTYAITSRLTEVIKNISPKEE